MPKKIRCHCAGKASCRLCQGVGKYEYDPGPMGYIPFRCPTCAGKGWLVEPGIETEKCPTCRGNGNVDPADPPHNGIFDVIWKALKPGMWMIHCHISHHTTNNNSETNGGGGLMMHIDVAGDPRT